MKLLSILFFSAFLMTSNPWLTDMNEAKKQAYQHHKLILLNFSGSDWCSPCMQMKKKIFDSEAFSQFADSSLILVNADFPRKRKNKPAAEQVIKNEALAEKYNPTGKFPYTLLLNDDGSVVREWDGFNGISAAEFIQQVQAHADAAR